MPAAPGRGQAVARPLLLLDVDGVLNALADDDEELASWPSWSRGRAESDGTRWPIVWSPEVVAQLRSWHTDGVLELQWLTTWGHDANHELAGLLGLPQLDVAGTYEEAYLLAGIRGGASAGVGTSHAAVTPSAPDPLTGKWWKYDVVRRMLEDQPGRTIIWVDDELHDPGSPYVAWAAAQPGVVAVGPDPVCGLSPDDLAKISASC